MCGGKVLQREIFGQIFIDIYENFVNLFIFYYIVPDGFGRIIIGAADLHEQFGQIGGGQRIAAEFFALPGFGYAAA